MLVSAVIISFVLGVFVTLFLQYVFIRRKLLALPKLEVDKRPQSEKFKLPKVIARSLGFKSTFRRTGTGSKRSGIKKKDVTKSPAGGDSEPKKGDLVSKEREEKGTEDKKGSLSAAEEQILVLNLLFHFLFQELKDTPKLRQWATRKMNTEFEEMLNTGMGKFLSGIQIRDFNFGSVFPVVKVSSLEDIKIEDDLIQTLDVGLDIDYDGGFQLAVDVDIVLQTWAYLSIKVTKLCGRARLQLTRIPFTHWSFSFYEEPKLEFEVDSRFNGRPLPQISSLIVNQIKRTIRKKHILPNYKMRFKPVFIRVEDSKPTPVIRYRGMRLSQGQLLINVVSCTRLPLLPSDCRLYCTLSVDKEDMEEVWRQSWITIDVEVKIPQNSPLGLTMKEQVSGQKSEKHRLIVDHVNPESPADTADIKKDDIITLISGTKVMSLKHAMKLMKNSGDRYVIQLKREQKNMSQEELLLYRERHPDSQVQLRNKETYQEVVEDSDEFIHISAEEDLRPASPLSVPVSIKDQAPKKLSDSPLAKKGMSLISAGKKKLLGAKEGKELTVEPDQTHLRRKSNPLETDVKAVSDINAAKIITKDRSQSAKSSPQKQARDMKRLRAHSDTSLNKQVLEGDSSSTSGDGDGELQEDKRLGQVTTREVPYSKAPEWNEEFKFDCSEKDQYVNICVWCKMVQMDRIRKQAVTKGDDSKLQVSDMIERYYVTKKIGYASLPLSDITAGCMLTLQGTCTYTVYLQPPEEMIVASHSKLPYSTHPGYDPSIAVGDITLSFTHKPFSKVDPAERKKVVHDILYPSKEMFCETEEQFEEHEEGQHKFNPMHFQSGTRCDFCGKKVHVIEKVLFALDPVDFSFIIDIGFCSNMGIALGVIAGTGVTLLLWPTTGPHRLGQMASAILGARIPARVTIARRLLPKVHVNVTQIWLKEAMYCDLCKMVCHKKCIEKCRGQTFCSVKGVKLRSNPDEPWLPPVRTSSNELEKEETSKPSIFRKLRNKESASLPLNIPSRQSGGDISPSASPIRSPLRGPSPLTVNAPNMSHSHSNTSIEKFEEEEQKSRLPGYSLDDQVVIEAKEKGRELFAHLSLTERKQTLDDKLTSLKDAIDKESEHKCELIKLISETSEVPKKKVLNQQLDKCEEKLESLMMMMVHYCAGLQHCLDMEEAQRRLQEDETGLQVDGVGDAEGDGVEVKDSKRQRKGEREEVIEEDETEVAEVDVDKDGDITIRGRVMDKGGEGEGDGAVPSSEDSDSLDGTEDAGIQFIVTEEHA